MLELRENLLGSLKELRGIQPLWHPLGFVSCFLKNESSHRIRLHYWPRNDRRPKSPDWPIHTHTFRLESLILYGQVVDRQYELVSGDDYTLYQVEYMGENSKVSETTVRCGVKLRQELIRNEGETYIVDSGSFHETFVGAGDEALTIVECTEFLSDAPYVVGKRGSQVIGYRREEYDRTKFWNRVTEILKP
ncbi:MAG: hypothetical protein WD044_16250 [Dongiaceae bacterium]